MKNDIIKLTINGLEYTATLEDNVSAKALKEHLSHGGICVDMKDYGDMEKVGSLSFFLPRNDKQIATAPGDLILYQGNMLVIYYDKNVWSLTRLGKINNISTREDIIKMLGGKGEVKVHIALYKG